MKPWLLVSPASQGIGLHLAKKLFQTTAAPMVITARKDIDKLRDQILEESSGKDEDRLHVLPLDYLKEETIAAASEQCRSLFPTSSYSLHLAYVIPGVLFAEKAPSQIDHDKALLTLRTNTLGPMLFMKHFVNFLPPKSASRQIDESDEAWRGLDMNLARWVFMSARVGSISDNKLGGWWSYRSSKAAVTQATKTFDHFVSTKSGKNAMAIAMHPGTVQTGLSKDYWGTTANDKLFEPAWVADRLVKLCTTSDGIGLQGRGLLWDWDGKEIHP